ncbi:MAG TPA: hypothetical protein VFZ53_15735, partial [Polyangiaceae bacterium]
MMRGIFVTALCLGFSLTGCGSDEGGAGANSGGTGGTGGSGGTGGAPECDDAFAVVPFPYAPNTTIDEWGGFAVDERGAVFTAIPDTSLTENTSDYSPVIMASDLAGNVTTLYTDDGSSLFGNLILRGDH